MACAPTRKAETKGFEPLSTGNFVGHWKSLIKPAYDKLGPPSGDFDAHCETLCKASVEQGIENLRTYPFVREREEAGTLSLHGAYYDIAEGTVTAMDGSGAFAAVA